MPTPSNDAFVNATPITGAIGSVTGQTTIGATAGASASPSQSGEPGHYNFNKGPAYPGARVLVGPYATVWYIWVCPTTDYYYFTTRDLTGAMLTNFLSTLQAFTGTSVGALTPVTMVMDQSVGDGNGADNGASIAFQAISGTTYYFQVDGRGGSTGNFQLLWGQYLWPRFGPCTGCGPDWNTYEVCIGTVGITDVTVDGIYNFGTFAAAAGRWQVKYCGGAFKVYTFSSGSYGFYGTIFDPSSITSTAWCTYCGMVYTAVASCFIWDYGTAYISGEVALLTDHLLTNTAALDYSNMTFLASTTTIPLSPEAAPGDWTLVSNPGALNFNYLYRPDEEYDTSGGWGAPIYSVGNPGVNSTQVWPYGTATTANICGWLNPSISSLYRPDVTTYSDWSSTGLLLTPITTYATAAEAIAANRCAATSVFDNPSGGKIGLAFPTQRVVSWSGGVFNNISKSSICDNSAIGNPAAQLLYYPFTTDVISASDFTLTGSGTSWTITFNIGNVSVIDFNNTTVTLQNTGGVSGASSPVVIDIAASAVSTSGSFTFTATPGLVTATIQLARNGVTAFTLSFPLYPVISLSFTDPSNPPTYSGLNIFERVGCSPNTWVQYLQQNTVFGGGLPASWGNTVNWQFSVASGPATIANDSAINVCTPVANISGVLTLGGTSKLCAPSVLVTGSVQSVPIQCTLIWNSISLPTFTQILSIPAT